MSNGRAMRRRMSPFAPRIDSPLPKAPLPKAPRPVTTRQPMVAYGARCAWWDDKSHASRKASGLPCCPHCGGVLFESDMTEWWAGAHRHEDDGHPGYVAFLRWLKGKCFPDLEAARAAYEAAS